MVAAFDDVESCRKVVFLDGRAEFVGGAEGVAGALNEQHGRGDLRQVRVAQLFWFAGRVEWVAKEN